ncbi:MAG: sugar ABC transporter permease [Caldilineaceae bacterium]
MAVATAPGQRAQGMSRQERRNQLLGLLFISPWLIGFVSLAVIPLVMSFYYGLTRYDLISEPKFIGLGNYERLFTNDPDFWKVIGNTFYYVLLGVPIGAFVAFLIANLLNTDIKGRALFRSIIYIPTIVPAVCTAMVWLFLLNTQYGAINGLLKAFEWPTIPFLSSPGLSKPTLILIYIWAQGSAVVIYLAALQDVPRSLYEAATVDGANGWHKFWNVTVPLCTPVILFNSIMGFIGAFQEFTFALVAHARRAGEINRTLCDEPLSQCLCPTEYGQSVGDGLDFIGDHCSLHRDSFQHLGALGLLWR